MLKRSQDSGKNNLAWGLGTEIKDRLHSLRIGNFYNRQWFADSLANPQRIRHLVTLVASRVNLLQRAAGLLLGVLL